MKLPYNVKFQREKASTELMAEMLPLLAAHWKEIAHFQDIPLNPDLSTYQRAEELNNLRCFTFRENGDLKGYAVFLIRYNPHYMTSLQAQQDVLYIDPKSRGTLPIKFLKFCDEQLAAEGVQAVYHHVKAAHNFGLILQRQGYELVDLIYAKRLD